MTATAATASSERSFVSQLSVSATYTSNKLATGHVLWHEATASLYQTGNRETYNHHPVAEEKRTGWHQYYSTPKINPSQTVAIVIDLCPADMLYKGFCKTSSIYTTPTTMERALPPTRHQGHATRETVVVLPRLLLRRLAPPSTARLPAPCSPARQRGHPRALPTVRHLAAARTPPLRSRPHLVPSEGGKLRTPVKR